MWKELSGPIMSICFWNSIWVLDLMSTGILLACLKRVHILIHCALYYYSTLGPLIMEQLWKRQYLKECVSCQYMIEEFGVCHIYALLISLWVGLYRAMKICVIDNISLIFCFFPQVYITESSLFIFGHDYLSWLIGSFLFCVMRRS